MASNLDMIPLFVADLILSGLLLGGLYIIIALGLNLIYGTLRILNIAYGDFLMIGAYITYWLFALYDIMPLLSLLITIPVMAVFGMAIYKGVFSRLIKKIRSKDVLNNVSLLIFFGIILIIENTAALFWSTSRRAIGFTGGTINILGTSYTFMQITSFAIAIATSLVLYFFLRKSWTGKAISVVIQDEEAASLMGINLDRVYLVCFILSMILAGVAGMSVGVIYEINPFMGLPYTVIAFVVLVLGGAGDIRGSMIGGLILAMVQTTGTYITSPGLSLAILYGVFISLLIIKPKGLFGRF